MAPYNKRHDERAAEMTGRQDLNRRTSDASPLSRRSNLRALLDTVPPRLVHEPVTVVVEAIADLR
jgi:hypothetical protein